MFVAALLLTSALVSHQADLPAPKAGQASVANVTSAQTKAVGVPTAERRPVDFSPDYKGVMFRMQIEGQEAWAILDNTVPRTVVDSAFARAVGLSLSDAPSGAATITVQDQRQAAPAAWLVAPTTLLIPGQVEFSNFPLTAMDLSLLSHGSKRIDVVIGRDVLGGVALGIDPITHTFRLAAGGAARGIPGAISLPLVGSQIEIMVGATPLRVSFELNASGKMSLTPAAWARVAPPEAELKQRTSGPSGMTRMIGYGRLPSFSLGTLQQPETDVAVLPWGDDKGDGVLGYEFYSQFITLMDPKQGRIWLLPRVPAETSP